MKTGESLNKRFVTGFCRVLMEIERLGDLQNVWTALTNYYAVPFPSGQGLQAHICSGYLLLLHIKSKKRLEALYCRSSSITWTAFVVDC